MSQSLYKLYSNNIQQIWYHSVIVYSIFWKTRIHRVRYSQISRILNIQYMNISRAKRTVCLTHTFFKPTFSDSRKKILQKGFSETAPLTLSIFKVSILERRNSIHLHFNQLLDLLRCSSWRSPQFHSKNKKYEKKVKTNAMENPTAERICQLQL